MLPEADLSHWPTKEQAAAALGCSTKTVQNLAKGGKLQHGTRRQAETGAIAAVYHPEDVERMRRERNPEAAPFVMPERSAELAGDKEVRLVREASARMGADEFIARLAAALSGNSGKLLEDGASGNSRKRPEVPLEIRIYLSVPEAAALSGLPKVELRRLMHQGELPARRTGAGWRIRRTDLEGL